MCHLLSQKLQTVKKMNDYDLALNVKIHNYIIISLLLLLVANKKIPFSKKWYVLLAKYSLLQFAGMSYPTDTFHSKLSIVANAKLPTALFPSYRSVHAAISRMTCHPCLIRRTFLTCFSWVSYQWWSTAVNSTIGERRGEVAIAALSSFHFPDSVPYNVCRRLLI